MRFNSRELACLAQQARERFDKEGLLHIKEKQEGLFRKGEVYTERLFRLRGNLLFYFKLKDPNSEVLGVIVLERCAVELDPDEELPYSFVLVFDGDDKVQHLAANSERDRASWIESLHIASYECMKMQLESLREQLRARTGKDPIDDPDPSVLPDSKPGEPVSMEEPFLEMCLTCDNLPCDNRPPNTFISISVMTPPSKTWMPYKHTETVERSLNPCYLTTIGFTDPNMILLTTRVRLTVYDVKERMTHTMNQLGSAMFSITDLLTAPGFRLRLRLNSSDFEDAGNVTVMAWQNDAHFEQLNGDTTKENEEPEPEMKPPPLPIRGKTKRLEMLKPLYDNIITRTYRFPTNTGSELGVHEYMGESKLTFQLPRQLLKLWVEEEKGKIDHLQELGELEDTWNGTREELADFHMSTVSMYTQNARYLAGYTGAPFKPSCKKGHKEVEFAPTNLHLQRMWVQNEEKRQSACYDVTTVGAFTAYSHKFKHGGLRRLLRQLRESVTENLEGRNKLDAINTTLNNMTNLRMAVHRYSEAVCRAAVQGDAADLDNSMSALQDKTRQLIQVCENPLVEMGVKRHTEAKGVPRPFSDPEGYLTAGNDPRLRDPSPEKSWKWSGTDFVKSPTEEPWEMTRLNTEAALVCILSKVEEIVKASGANGDGTTWLEDISPLVIKLKSCVEVTFKRAKSSLTILTIEESSQNVALMHTIKLRRDVVFSQALTSAVGAFMTKLRSSMTDETFLKQLFQIGILMEFESLLSCHGDELGMLEDMAVGVQDLSHVVFKVDPSSSSDDIMPCVKGDRTGYVVHMTVPEAMFQLLPKEIQRGHSIKVVPVLFSIGINEQQTFAEKFGDTSVQEAVNIENYQRLNSYYEKYIDIIGEPDMGEKCTIPMEQLLRHLHINVMSKKSKNVEVLHMAAEVCRKLNGIRFTSCKSAKDRTAMGVTLEQVQLLQREHDLAAHVFMHAMECMRSEGVRRENTQKNTGSRKYAFNSLQLLSVPKLYRPPNGTFGNVQT